jgi:hypothetical protein
VVWAASWANPQRTIAARGAANRAEARGAGRAARWRAQAAKRAKTQASKRKVQDGPGIQLVRTSKKTSTRRTERAAVSKVN